MAQNPPYHPRYHLFANTTDTAVLEQLAGVPAGTAERHDAARAEFYRAVEMGKKKAGRADPFVWLTAWDKFSRYCSGLRKIHLLRWREFLEEGLGEFPSEPGTQDVVARHRLSLRGPGQTTDIEAVAQLLYAEKATLPAGVTIGQLEGVHWE